MTQWTDFKIPFKVFNIHTTQSKEWDSPSAHKARGMEPASIWSFSEN